MQELYKAFINFQKDFKGLKPDADNPFFKSNYISLDGILETVRPLLVTQGLAVIQNAFTTDDGCMAVKTLLIHESGQSLETETMTMKPQKDDPQQRGSVVTYMKRYQLGALLGICESIDDDANLATRGKETAKPSGGGKPGSKANASEGQGTSPVGLKCAVCGVEVAAAVKTFSEKQFGKCLCRDCQGKVKKGA